MNSIATSPRCPVCLSNDTHLTKRITARECAAFWVLESEEKPLFNNLIEHIISLWSNDEAEIYGCNSCTFGFINPYVGGDAKYYDLCYDGVNCYPDRWEFTRIAKYLRSLKPARSVLEIGPGDGVFLDKIVPWHVDPSGVFALEFRMSSVDLLKQKRYNAFAVDVMEAESVLHGKLFDSIFAFHLVEHVNNSRALFKKFRELLYPGGNLFISLPNKHRIDFNERTGSLIDIPPHHIGRWNPQVFQKLCDQFGFEMVTFEYQPVPLTKFFLGDLYAAHKQRTIENKFLAIKARSIKNLQIGRVIVALEMILFSPTRFVAWTQAMTDRDIRTGPLWVHLRKKES